MAIILEDGTGLSTAETLVSVAEADLYHSNRGNSDWAALNEAQKEQKLRVANDMLNELFWDRWKGILVNYDQGCGWPRYGIVNYGSDEIPRRVKNEVCRLADHVRENGDDRIDDTQKIVREKVGPIETVFDTYSLQVDIGVSVALNLAEFLQSGGNGINRKLER